jgi:hypothetical protein
MVELGMTPRSAKHKISYDEDFLSDVATSFHHYVSHGELDEDRPRSKQMRRMPPGGYSVTNTEIDPDARRVTGVDLTQNPEMTIGLDEPQWDYTSIQPTNPAATDMSTHTQDQRDRLLRVSGDDGPMDECNYTMENKYCPVHGLEECYGQGVYESELARIKLLSLLK